MRRKTYTLAYFALLNAACMLGLTLFWLSLPRTFGDEVLFIKWTSIVKKSLLGFDERPKADEVLYVDVAGSKQVLDIPDPFYEETTGFHRAVITDREQLNLFLSQVAAYGSDIPLVLLDISFERPSPADLALQATIDSFPFPILAAQRLDDSGQLSPSTIRLPLGVANYLSTDFSFMKYPLFLKDTLPTLPLLAWSVTEGKSFSNERLWPRLDGRSSLPKPIIDFKIRPFHINRGGGTDTTGYSLRALGTLIFEWDFWQEEDIRELLRGKTIVVGDFLYDRHETVFGIMPGPMIVHNAYLTLKADESLIPWSWLLLLYALFFWMIIRSTREVLEREQGAKRKFKAIIGDLLADSLDETLFLILATVLSYFVFNIHINILVALIYLKITAYLFGRFVLARIPDTGLEPVTATSPESGEEPEPEAELHHTEDIPEETNPPSQLSKES